jgi:hypothetical protein
MKSSFVPANYIAKQGLTEKSCFNSAEDVLIRAGLQTAQGHFRHCQIQYWNEGRGPLLSVEQMGRVQTLHNAILRAVAVQLGRDLDPADVLIQLMDDLHTVISYKGQVLEGDAVALLEADCGALSGLAKKTAHEAMKVLHQSLGGKELDKPRRDVAARFADHFVYPKLFANRFSKLIPFPFVEKSGSGATLEPPQNLPLPPKQDGRVEALNQASHNWYDYRGAEFAKDLYNYVYSNRDPAIRAALAKLAQNPDSQAEDASEVRLWLEGWFDAAESYAQAHPDQELTLDEKLYQGFLEKHKLKPSEEIKRAYQQYYTFHRWFYPLMLDLNPHPLFRHIFKARTGVDLCVLGQ